MSQLLSMIGQAINTTSTTMTDLWGSLTTPGQTVVGSGGGLMMMRWALHKAHKHIRRDLILPVATRTVAGLYVPFLLGVRIPLVTVSHTAGRVTDSFLGLARHLLKPRRHASCARMEQLELFVDTGGVPTSRPDTPPVSTDFHTAQRRAEIVKRIRQAMETYAERRARASMSLSDAIKESLDWKEDCAIFRVVGRYLKSKRLGAKWEIELGELRKNIKEANETAKSMFERVSNAYVNVLDLGDSIRRVLMVLVIALGLGLVISAASVGLGQPNGHGLIELIFSPTRVATGLLASGLALSLHSLWMRARNRSGRTSNVARNRAYRQPSFIEKCLQRMLDSDSDLASRRAYLL